jgi:hypothetical protein
MVILLRRLPRSQAAERALHLLDVRSHNGDPAVGIVVNPRPNCQEEPEVMREKDAREIMGFAAIGASLEVDAESYSAHELSSIAANLQPGTYLKIYNSDALSVVELTGIITTKPRQIVLAYARLNQLPYDHREEIQIQGAVEEHSDEKHKTEPRE